MPALDLAQVLTGVLLAAAAAGLGYLGKALSRGGAIAAFFLGSVLFGLGGIAWAALLLAFFIPSSLLSAIFKTRKASAEAGYEKGSRRDAWQVVANGGLTGLCAVAHWILPGSMLPWLAASAALAAASADTWATELGALSRKDPVMITSGRSVERGTSGAVSFEGEIAALLGAGLIAMVSTLLFPTVNGPNAAVQPSVLLITVILGGFIGCQVDSILGATLQATYFCPSCRRETERHPLHTCGTRTEPLRGIRWMNNDWVNFYCTLSAALVAGLISTAF